MTKQQYTTKIQEIMETKWQATHDALVAVTNEYCETTPAGSPFSFDETDSDGNFARSLDSLALTRAWIEDRLNHRYPKDRRAITKKIRKVLGYTYA